MLRGVFLPSVVTTEQVDFYVDLFKQVGETAKWQKFMEDGAFNAGFMSGADFVKWIEQAERAHRELMQEGGFKSNQ